MTSEYMNACFGIERVNSLSDAKQFLVSICGIEMHVPPSPSRAFLSRSRHDEEFHKDLNMLMELEKALNQHQELDLKLARNLVKALVMTLSVFPTSLICWSQNKELMKETGHQEMVHACSDIINMMVSGTFKPMSCSYIMPTISTFHQLFKEIRHCYANGEYVPSIIHPNIHFDIL